MRRAFVPCSWWAVSALAVAGRREEALDRADRLCALLPALLPEEFDPAGERARGNVPLVWSPVEAARALHLADEGNLLKRASRSADTRN